MKDFLFLFLISWNITHALSPDQSQKSIWYEATENKTINSFMPNFIRRHNSWQHSIEESSSAVVQVRTCNLHFDWIHPYRAAAQSYGCGSAFFINEEGHLITNAHVIRDSCFTQIVIPGCGKEFFTVDILGMSPNNPDIALLKLQDEAKARVIEKLGKIPFLLLGDSDQIEKSEKVAAIGYPLGLDNVRCTQGVFAGREYSGMNSYLHITSNATHGNSGGPVVDKNGNVIGIVVAGRKETELIGYAIPVNNIKNVLNLLQENPLYRFPRLYIKGNYSSEELCEKLHTPVAGGLFVSQIAEHSLLYKAGLRTGDILHALIHNKTIYTIDRFGEVEVSWNNDPVPLFELYYRLPHNEPIKYVAYRQEQQISGEFIIKNQELLPIKEQFPIFEEIDYEVFGGLVMMNLAENHIPYFYSKKNAGTHPWIFECKELNSSMKNRVIITDVLGGSPAFESRTLSPGCIIRKINDKDVYSLDDVRNAIKLSQRNKFITIEEYYSGFLVVLSIEKILATEKKLAQQYRFSPSSLLEYLS